MEEYGAEAGKEVEGPGRSKGPVRKGGPRRGHGHGHGHNEPQPPPLEVEVEEKDPLMLMFIKIGLAFNEGHIAWDECSHLSRQITWESKRAISQVLGYFQNPKTLDHAGYNLNNIERSEKYFKGLARMLYNLDEYKYCRCYSPAIQEYIEAYALYTFSQEGRLAEYEEIRNRLTFELEVPVEAEEDNGSKAIEVEALNENQAVEEGGERKQPEMKTVTYKIYFSETDYYLGICDITGELVRACVAVLHTKNFKYFLFSSVSLVQSLYNCLQRVYPFPKQLLHKLNVMRSSLIKLEKVCYHVTIETDRYSSSSLIGSDIMSKDSAVTFYDEDGDDDA